jgi:hypothetical protein
MKRSWRWGIAGVVGLGLFVVALPTGLEWAAGRGLRAAGYDGAQVDVERLDPGGIEVTVRLDEAGRQKIERLRLDWSLGGLIRGRLDRVEIAGVRLRLEDGGGGGSAFRVPSLPVEQIWIADSRITVGGTGQSLSLTIDLEADESSEGKGFDIRGTVGLTWAHGQTRVETVGQLDLSDDRIRYTPAKCLTVQGKATELAGISLAEPGRLCIRGVKGRPLVEVASGADGAASVTSEFRIDPVSLALAAVKGKTAPIRTAGGSVGLDGRVAWGGDGLTGRGRLMLKDVAVDTGTVTAKGISGVLTADRLDPLTLPAGQKLAVALVDIGMPLTDGVFQFGLDRRGTLEVTQAEWGWAGGTLRAAPFRTGLIQPEGTVELEAEGVGLGAVLELAAVEGLQADGTLRGRLPVSIGAQTLSVDHGRLETTGPGTLRYDPAEPPAFLTGNAPQILMQVLTDFRYESLALEIDGTAGKTMTLGLKVHGANPEFQDGYPVVLNVNLSGALDTIVQRGINTWRIPDTVRDKMMEFQNQDE